MNEPINIARPDFGEDEERSVLEVLRSGAIAQGAKVRDLEALFAEAAGTNHAVAVTSGTAALIASLRCLESSDRHEVITSPFTFAASVNAIIKAGLTVRFADIGEDFNVSPDSVASLVNDRTRAIVPVHLYGLSVDMQPIVDISNTNGLRIVEDAAQAIGATYFGRPVGSFDIACFSMYATKNVTTGEGGMVTTDDLAIADRLRLMRNQGMGSRYEYLAIGENLRMTDLQAAVGIPQMRRLQRINETRRENAATLTETLQGIRGLVLPSEPHDRYHVYHQYTVRVTEQSKLDRDDLVHALGEMGIGTGVYYPKAIPDYEIYRDHPAVVATDPIPNARAFAQQVVSLPVHHRLSNDAAHRIAAAVSELLQ
jgi:dTDP-4-amino-4,6-dideoxygalactose transaminase